MTECNRRYLGVTYQPAPGVDPDSEEFAEFVAAYQDAHNTTLLRLPSWREPLAVDRCLGPATAASMRQFIRAYEMGGLDPDAFEAWYATVIGWLSEVNEALSPWADDSIAGAGSPRDPNPPAANPGPPPGAPAAPGATDTSGGGGAIGMVLGLLALLALGAKKGGR